jgi:hypothetical protein
MRHLLVPIVRRRHILGAVRETQAKTHAGSPSTFAPPRIHSHSFPLILSSQCFFSDWTRSSGCELGSIILIGVAENAMAESGHGGSCCLVFDGRWSVCSELVLPRSNIGNVGAVKAITVGSSTNGQPLRLVICNRRRTCELQEVGDNSKPICSWGDWSSHHTNGCYGV